MRAANVRTCTADALDVNERISGMTSWPTTPTSEEAILTRAGRTGQKERGSTRKRRSSAMTLMTFLTERNCDEKSQRLLLEWRSADRQVAAGSTGWP